MPSHEPEGEILPPNRSSYTNSTHLPDFETERAEAQAPPSPGSYVPPPKRRGAGPPRATYLLVGVNVAVFIWMVLHGVSITDPRPQDLVRFGATDPALVLLHGQWYRLLTATFVHVGIVHIGTNMWCLWNLGLLGEPLLGLWGTIAVYMLTGVAGNLLSLAVNVVMAVMRRDPSSLFSVGAGASGAVFGIAGILIVLLSNRRLPIAWPELQRLRRSVIQFAGLNLVIGLATVFSNLIRIDNMAHIGGFLSGLALGPPLLPRMTSGRAKYLARQKITFAVAALILMLFAHWIGELR